MSDAFQNELTFLGIESSPAFVRAPESNGCAERFIRTLKENLLWVRHFETIEQLRHALLACHWGRIGTQGRIRLDPHPNAGAAVNALARLARSKRRRGYREQTEASNTISANRPSKVVS